MKKSLSLLFFLMLVGAVSAQVTLRSGSVVPLELSTTVQSNSAVQGQTVDFRVVYDVVVDQKTVIPAGTLAKGIVRRVVKSKGAGRGGVVEVQVESINLNGQSVPLYSNSHLVEGENKKGLVWGLTGGGFLVIGPLSFFFLLIKGESAVIQAGTKLDATVVRNVIIDTK